MTGFLTVLWDASLGALLTSSMILVLRLLLRNVLTPKAKYYLWLLLALRLMVPVLPESPTSLWNVLPQSHSSPAVIAPAPTAAGQAEGPAAPELLIPSEPIAPMQVQATDSPVSQPENSPVREHIAPTTLLFLLWLFGAGAVLVFHVLRYAVTARQLHSLPDCTDPETQSVFQALKKRCGIRRNVRLALGGGGMLGGLIHPTIVLPPERRGADLIPILLHEMMHLKAHDLWVMGLYRLLRVIYWFHPMVWLCFHLARNDSEAACDQRVLSDRMISPASYARLLYEEGVMNMNASTTFGFGSSNLKHRIQNVLRYKPPRVWTTVLAIVLALALVGVGFYLLFSAMDRAARAYQPNPGYAHLTVTRMDTVRKAMDQEKLDLSLPGVSEPLTFTMYRNVTYTDFGSKTSIPHGTEITCDFVNYSLRSWGGAEYYVTVEINGHPKTGAFSKRDLVAMYRSALRQNGLETQFQADFGAPLSSRSAKKALGKIDRELYEAGILCPGAYPFDWGFWEAMLDRSLLLFPLLVIALATLLSFLTDRVRYRQFLNKYNQEHIENWHEITGTLPQFYSLRNSGISMAPRIDRKPTLGDSLKHLFAPQK